MTAVELNTSVPHSARIYDYLLGGKDNFQADRDAAEELLLKLPSIATSMRANRRFMARAAGYLAGELGIRQFLDIGTGLPTSPNMHEVVQAIDPTCRVVYVDNDPIVLTHARALLTSSPQGRTGYIDADLRQVGRVLGAPQFTETIDVDQPVSVSLIAVLQFVLDEDEARGIIAGYLAPMPPGSTLTLSVVTTDSNQEQGKGAVATYNDRGIAQKARSRAETEQLFTGLELLDPGVVLVHQWRPAEEDRLLLDSHVHMWCGVAVKR